MEGVSLREPFACHPCAGRDPVMRWIYEFSASLAVTTGSRSCRWSVKPGWQMVALFARWNKLAWMPWSSHGMTSRQQRMFVADLPVGTCIQTPPVILNGAIWRSRSG